MKMGYRALQELRRDLIPIKEAKSILDDRQRYQIDGEIVSPYGYDWKKDKQKALLEGVKEIKKMIIELGEKYKEEK